VGVYIYGSENIAIRNRNITEFGLEHRNAMSGTQNRNRNKIRTGTRLRNRNKIRNRNWNRD